MHTSYATFSLALTFPTTHWRFDVQDVVVCCSYNLPPLGLSRHYLLVGQMHRCRRMPLPAHILLDTICAFTLSCTAPRTIHTRVPWNVASLKQEHKSLWKCLGTGDMSTFISSTLLIAMRTLAADVHRWQFGFRTGK